MRWQGSSWVPYVPSYPSAGTPKWVRAIYSDNSFEISGPTGLAMVRVTLPQSNITRSGNNVTMDYQLSFTFESGNELVGQVEYDTYLMGNDYFSFTPYDNYTAYPSVDAKIDDYWQEGQLRYRTTPAIAQTYARQWAPTGYKWNIDLQSPTVDSLGISVVDETELNLAWTVADSNEIYAIVGNIYASTSMPDTTDPLLLSESGTTLNIVSPFTLNKDFTDDDIGVLNTGYAFRKLNIGGTDHLGSINIDLQNNKEGSLIIYLAVFDIAGNVSISSMTYSLGDWIVTDGGLTYSSDGMNFEVRDFAEGTVWSASAIADMDPYLADVSNEMFADNRVSGTEPSSLVKSSRNNSYHFRPFNVDAYTNDRYSELRRAYNDREIEGKAEMLTNITDLSGNLNNVSYGCFESNSVCILNKEGDLTVGNTSDFVCDNRGVFFVTGNLTIKRQILNNSANADACMFIVQGSVLIEDGEKQSSSGQLEYDEIHAYIITDGSITIEAETDFINKYDGVYVEGGLQSQLGLSMNRTLKLVDRNMYPALVVRHHPKYAVLSNIVFGSNIEMPRTESGFKPY